MRIPNAIHEWGPWRIRDIAPDFILEDLWELPAHGAAEDFPRLVELITSLDFPASAPLAVRVLWTARDRLGRWCNLGRITVPAPTVRRDDAPRLPIPGTTETSLAGRLPHDLRGTATNPAFRSTPFVPLYATADEYAAELSNRTVHAVLHLAWADQGDGVHHGQMAVYVKPRGRLGEAYMALIKPFRYVVVYPALMRHIERAWNGRDVVTPAVG